VKFLLGIFEAIEGRSEKVFHDTNGDFSVQIFQRVLEFARISFALVMLGRYGHAWTATPLFELWEGSWPLLYLGLYWILLVGALTPLACLILFFLEINSPLFIAVKINSLIPIVLFFLGAGRLYSIDQWLDGRFSRYRRLLNRLRLPLDQFPKLRFYLFLPYGLMSLQALNLHFQDEFWRTLQVNEKLFEVPFATLIPSAWQKACLDSILFSPIAAGMAAVQIFWEATLIPSMLFRRPLLISVAYGLIFFSVSKFVLNLNSLGTMEMIYWLILFHPELFKLFKKLVGR
jgi:hypothetical protein